MFATDVNLNLKFKISIRSIGKFFGMNSSEFFEHFRMHLRYRYQKGTNRIRSDDRTIVQEAARAYQQRLQGWIIRTNYPPN